MDEATSALDAATTELVLRNVREYMKDGVLVLITHDAGIAQGADVVIEFTVASAAIPSGSADSDQELPHELQVQLTARSCRPWMSARIEPFRRPSWRARRCRRNIQSAGEKSHRPVGP